MGDSRRRAPQDCLNRATGGLQGCGGATLTTLCCARVPCSGAASPGLCEGGSPVHQSALLCSAPRSLLRIPQATLCPPACTPPSPPTPLPFHLHLSPSAYASLSSDFSPATYTPSPRPLQSREASLLSAEAAAFLRRRRSQWLAAAAATEGGAAPGSPPGGGGGSQRSGTPAPQAAAAGLAWALPPDQIAIYNRAGRVGIYFPFERQFIIERFASKRGRCVSLPVTSGRAALTEARVTFCLGVGLGCRRGSWRCCSRPLRTPRCLSLPLFSYARPSLSFPALAQTAAARLRPLSVPHPSLPATPPRACNPLPSSPLQARVGQEGALRLPQEPGRQAHPREGALHPRRGRCEHRMQGACGAAGCEPAALATVVNGPPS